MGMAVKFLSFLRGKPSKVVTKVIEGIPKNAVENIAEQPVLKTLSTDLYEAKKIVEEVPVIKILIEPLGPKAGEIIILPNGDREIIGEGSKGQRINDILDPTDRKVGCRYQDIRDGVWKDYMEEKLVYNKAGEKISEETADVRLNGSGGRIEIFKPGTDITVRDVSYFGNKKRTILNRYTEYDPDIFVDSPLGDFYKKESAIIRKVTAQDGCRADYPVYIMEEYNGKGNAKENIVSMKVFELPDQREFFKDFTILPESVQKIINAMEGKVNFEIK